MSDTDDLVAIAARQLNFLNELAGIEISPKASPGDVASIVEGVREAGITAASALYEIIETLNRTAKSPVVIRNSPPLLRRIVHRDDAGRITEVVDEPLGRSK